MRRLKRRIRRPAACLFIVVRQEIAIYGNSTAWTIGRARLKPLPQKKNPCHRPAGDGRRQGFYLKKITFRLQQPETKTPGLKLLGLAFVLVSKRDCDAYCVGEVGGSMNILRFWDSSID
jgi:hypothetical protein